MIQHLKKAYSANLYVANRFRDRYVRDLTHGEIEIERKHIFVLHKSCGNPDENMPKYILEYYEGDEKTYIDKDGAEGC